MVWFFYNEWFLTSLSTVNLNDIYFLHTDDCFFISKMSLSFRFSGWKLLLCISRKTAWDGQLYVTDTPASNILFSAVVLSPFALITCKTVENMIKNSSINTDLCNILHFLFVFFGEWRGLFIPSCTPESKYFVRTMLAALNCLFTTLAFA